MAQISGECESQRVQRLIPGPPQAFLPLCQVCACGQSGVQLALRQRGLSNNIVDRAFALPSVDLGLISASHMVPSIARCGPKTKKRNQTKQANNNRRGSADGLVLVVAPGRPDSGIPVGAHIPATFPSKGALRGQVPRSVGQGKMLSCPDQTLVAPLRNNNIPHSVLCLCHRS